MHTVDTIDRDDLQQQFPDLPNELNAGPLFLEQLNILLNDVPEDYDGLDDALGDLRDHFKYEIRQLRGEKAGASAIAVYQSALEEVRSWQRASGRAERSYQQGVEEAEEQQSGFTDYYQTTLLSILGDRFSEENFEKHKGSLVQDVFEGDSRQYAVLWATAKISPHDFWGDTRCSGLIKEHIAQRAPTFSTDQITRVYAATLGELTNANGELISAGEKVFVVESSNIVGEITTSYIYFGGGVIEDKKQSVALASYLDAAAYENSTDRLAALTTIREVFVAPLNDWEKYHGGPLGLHQLVLCDTQIGEYMDDYLDAIRSVDDVVQRDAYMIHFVRGLVDQAARGDVTLVAGALGHYIDQILLQDQQGGASHNYALLGDAIVTQKIVAELLQGFVNKHSKNPSNEVQTVVRKIPVLLEAAKADLSLSPAATMDQMLENYDNMQLSNFYEVLRLFFGSSADAFLTLIEGLGYSLDGLRERFELTEVDKGHVDSVLSDYNKLSIDLKKQDVAFSGLLEENAPFSFDAAQEALSEKMKFFDESLVLQVLEGIFADEARADSLGYAKSDLFVTEGGKTKLNKENFETLAEDAEAKKVFMKELCAPKGLLLTNVKQYASRWGDGTDDEKNEYIRGMDPKHLVYAMGVCCISSPLTLKWYGDDEGNGLQDVLDIGDKRDVGPEHNEKVVIGGLPHGYLKDGQFFLESDYGSRSSSLVDGKAMLARVEEGKIVQYEVIQTNVGYNVEQRDVSTDVFLGMYESFGAGELLSDALFASVRTVVTEELGGDDADKKALQGKVQQSLTGGLVSRWESYNGSHAEGVVELSDNVREGLGDEDTVKSFSVDGDKLILKIGDEEIVLYAGWPATRDVKNSV